MSTQQESPAFWAYRAELAGRAPLTPEVERDLTRRFRAGDRDAGRRLVEACLAFVITIAREYRRWGAPIEDLVQEGNVGLLKAADRFDPDRGTRLATYAAYWIRAEIREYVARGLRMVRLGSSKAERRALRAYRRTLNQDPAVLSELSGLSAERVTELLPLLTAPDVSLEQPPGDDRRSPEEALADGARSPEEQACLADQSAQIGAAVARVVAELPPREQTIVQRRLMSDDPETLEQLGATFGVSKERVRQLEVGAKKRLRARLEEIAGELLAAS
jgi:RNA polymerase sigma-32 factor